MARKKKEETSNNIAAYRMEFWYRIAMILLALVVMISVGLAWFANNREVNATQMSVRTSPGPFELAAEGSSGSYDTYIENGETKNRLSDGFYVPTETVEFTAYDKPHTGYKTSGSATSISWAVSSYSNLNNNTQSGVDPGASGSITFYIIPSEDG
ncbi:MAG: hypothetical protein PUD80_01850, partial [Firmicutes bacterium]|nr:hypothetical protein [Bacillota bacterium]